MFYSYLLKVMNGQPDFALCIEDTTKVAPRNCEVGLSFYGLQVACLDTHRNQNKAFWWDKDGNGRKRKREKRKTRVNIQVLAHLSHLRPLRCTLAKVNAALHHVKRHTIQIQMSGHNTHFRNYLYVAMYCGSQA